MKLGIEAAKSKPFGFMTFYLGLDLGGACIPIDPFLPDLWRCQQSKDAIGLI